MDVLNKGYQLFCLQAGGKDEDHRENTRINEGGHAECCNREGC